MRKLTYSLTYLALPTFISAAMYTFLLVLLVLDSLVLIAAVLLQSGKGGGLSASFGGASSSSDSFIGTRQAGNLLTQITLVGRRNFPAARLRARRSCRTRARTPTSVLDPLSRQSTSAPAAPAAGECTVRSATHAS